MELFQFRKETIRDITYKNKHITDSFVVFLGLWIMDLDFGQLSIIGGNDAIRFLNDIMNKDFNYNSLFHPD